jgi:hypothetical protein
MRNISSEVGITDSSFSANLISSVSEMFDAGTSSMKIHPDLDDTHSFFKGVL